MPAENNSQQDFRAAYIVSAGFLFAFALVTWAVTTDAQHRSDLEQVITSDQVSAR
jgi:hypothetical protein